LLRSGERKTLRNQSTFGEESTFWFDLELPEIEGQNRAFGTQETAEEIEATPDIREEEELPLIPPPQKELALLFELAQIGDILSIREQVTTLEASDQHAKDAE
jgi:hypothetical protein